MTTLPLNGKRQSIKTWSNNKYFQLTLNQIREAYNIATGTLEQDYLTPIEQTKALENKGDLFELCTAYLTDGATFSMLLRLMYKAFCLAKGAPCPIHLDTKEHNYPVPTLYRFNNYLRGTKTKFFNRDLMLICAMCHSNDRKSFERILKNLQRANILEVKEPNLELLISNAERNNPDQRIFLLLPFGYKFLTALFTDVLSKEQEEKKQLTILFTALETQALKSLSKQLGSDEAVGSDSKAVEQHPIPISTLIKQIMQNEEIQQKYIQQINIIADEGHALKGTYQLTILFSALETQALKSLSKQLGSDEAVGSDSKAVEQHPIPISTLIKQIMQNEEIQQKYIQQINIIADGGK